MVADEAGALVSYARLETPRHAGLAPLRLLGLAPDARYRVCVCCHRPARRR